MSCGETVNTPCHTLSWLLKLFHDKLSANSIHLETDTDIVFNQSLVVSTEDALPAQNIQITGFGRLIGLMGLNHFRINNRLIDPCKFGLGLIQINMGLITDSYNPLLICY